MSTQATPNSNNTNANINVLVVHGPNLNMLGQREPEKYGSQTLDDINNALSAKAQSANIALTIVQSNNEALLIETLQEASALSIDHIIINPAAYTHTSIAMRDAILSVNIPFIEVHLSNIYQRESFRHTSYFSDIAQGTITGLGAHGYLLALDAIINQHI